MLVERRGKVMNRHGDKKTWRKKNIKYECIQNRFQALSKPLVLQKACLGFQKGMLRLSIAPPKHLRSTALPLSRGSCSVHAREGGGSTADLCSESVEQESVRVTHCSDKSHLTAADSPTFLPLFTFLPVTKVGITKCWCTQIKLLLLRREATCNSVQLLPLWV